MDHHSMSNYMAHGFCYLWEPALVWLHVISDIATGLAYYSIPAAIFYFVYKRRDLPFSGMFVLFGVFIFSCGTTHLLAAYTVYVPLYWQEGIVKAITAVVSIGSAILFIPLLPKAIALPSLTKALEEIKTLNETLENQVEELRTRDSALREQNQFLQRMIDTIPSPIFYKDIGGRYQGCNKSFEAYIGQSKENIIGKSVYDLSPKELADKYYKMDRELFRNEGVQTYESRVQHADGTQHDVIFNKATYSGTDGALAGLIGVMTDITDRKKAEKKLMETSQTLQSLIHASPLAVTVLDPDGTVTMWNPAAERIFGWSEQEVVGRFYPVVPEEKKDEFRVFRERVLQGESFTGVEVVRRRKDGSSVDINLSTAPLRDFKGDVVGAMGVMADITERKKMEEQIKRSLMEKEILLKEIHHRVKNNLQIISSMLNLQSEYVKDKQTLDLFTESRNRVKSMALIHEKLYQSKDLARINFADYVRTLTEDLFRSYRGSSAEIALKIDVEDVFLNIDKAVSCGLIINELIANSLKHAFPSGRKGEIKISLHPDINGMFALTVSDNGTGLPENVDSRNVESLGLQLAGLLVEQLDGAIELDKSKGTSFRITFKETTTTGKG